LTIGRSGHSAPLFCGRLERRAKWIFPCTGEEERVNRTDYLIIGLSFQLIAGLTLFLPAYPGESTNCPSLYKD
jgi:hypothetical protein